MNINEFYLKRYKLISEQFKSGIEYAFQKRYIDSPPNTQMSEEEAVIIGLAQNINGLNYSIISLIETSNHYALDSALRALFENYVSLLFILQENTEFRARRYLYAKKNSEYELGEKLLQNNRRGRELRKFINMNEQQVRDDLFVKLDVYDIEEIRNTMLKELEFSWVSEKWYNVFSSKKLKKFINLCEYMKLQDEYDLIYHLLSKEAHAMDAFKSYEVEGNMLSLQPLNKNHIMHTNFGSRMNLDILNVLMKYFGSREKEREIITLLQLKKFL